MRTHYFSLRGHATYFSSSYILGLVDDFGYKQVLQENKNITFVAAYNSAFEHGRKAKTELDTLLKNRKKTDAATKRDMNSVSLA
jgi:hypothetical protein